MPFIHKTVVIISLFSIIFLQTFQVSTQNHGVIVTVRDGCGEKEFVDLYGNEYFNF